MVAALLCSCQREPTVIPVTGISVNPTEITLVEGGTTTVSVTVTPSDATDKSFHWSSSAPSVASVADGTVTALKKGSAEISVTTGDGRVKAVCRVTVESPAPVIIVSRKEFTLPSSGGTINLEVQSNVNVTVEMPSDAPWIKENTSKALSTRAFSFLVDANPDYDERSASIVFTDVDTGLSESISILQAQRNAIVISDSQVFVPDEGGTFEIQLASNVEYDVSIDGDWVRIQPDTKGLVQHSHVFVAAPLPEDAFVRELSIRFTERDGSLSSTMTVLQQDSSPIIQFKDNAVKDICVGRWDRNSDHELSMREASVISNLDRVFAENHTIVSFDELVYFTRLKSIPNSCFSKCTNLSSIVLPEGLESIGSNAFYNCSSLRGLLNLPETLTELGSYAFSNCSSLTGDLHIPDGVSVIPVGCFMGCTGFNGTLHLSEKLTEMGNYAFNNCPSFSKIVIDAVSPPRIGRHALCEVDCLIFVPSGKAGQYQTSPGWDTYKRLITEEGHKPMDFFYASTDYSRDGEVLCLQKAAKGKGIDIVFMGDGFLDKDMEPGGKYESVMKQWMEQFFVYEPYRSYRDWFTIYTVKVVSKNDVFNCPDAERRLTRDDGEGLYGNTISALYSVCDEYSNRIPGHDSKRVAIFMNSDVVVGRSYCSFDFGGNCRAWVFEGQGHPNVLNHELGGHGFGLLADEYIELNEAYPDRQVLESYFKYGSYVNADWKNDPATVNWSHFLSDPRYANEGLGVFEGAIRYAYGVYRSTESSLMNTPYEGVVFNAPSRESIYKQIMRFGMGDGWTYDYEEFVAADEAGRREAAEAYARSSANRSAGRYVERSENYQLGLPPMLLDGPIKEVRVRKDGKVTIIRQ